MALENTPDFPTRPNAVRLQQKYLLQWACGFLFLGAILLLTLPLGKIPRPVRVFTALSDFIGAAVIAVVIRQKYPR